MRLRVAGAERLAAHGDDSEIAPALHCVTIAAPDHRMVLRYCSIWSVVSIALVFIS